MGKLAIGLAALLMLVEARASAQGDRCDAARKLVASTRERLPPGALKEQQQEAVQNLRRATELCPGLGDAYYFLSLLAKELGDQPRSQMWRQRAEFHGSEAMRTGAGLFDRVVEPNPGPPPPLSVPPLPATRVSGTVRKKLALVVGISRFRDTGISSLKYTAKDAQAVASALERDCEFDYVKTLLDENATRYAIQTEMERLAKMAEPDDLVVIYASSHGSPENMDTAGVNYIVTHDAEVTNLYPTAYRMDDLIDDIYLRIKAARVIAFLDTCYSGGTFRQLPPGWLATSRSVAVTGGTLTSRIRERILQGGARTIVIDDADRVASTGRVQQGIGRVIITSSSQAERSWEDEKIEHGYFTYYLLQTLRKEGPVSVDDIFGQLRLRVPESVKRDKNESQHPSMARTSDAGTLYIKDRMSGRKPINDH